MSSPLPDPTILIIDRLMRASHCVGTASVEIPGEGQLKLFDLFNQAAVEIRERSTQCSRLESRISGAIRIIDEAHAYPMPLMALTEVRKELQE
jgi:hypothetical protein